MANRTSLTNEIRGLLSEYGIIFNQGINAIRKNLLHSVEAAQNSGERRGKNRAIVALANKNARRTWVLLAREEEIKAA